MIELFEQSHYGRFDTSHFGMWLNADMALNHPDYRRFSKLMWTTFHFPPEAEHTKYVMDLHDLDKAAFAATCFTLYSHEGRHFHDLIATPYGSMLMRQYVRAALFYTLLWHEVFFRRQAVVVPISDWITNEAVYGQVYRDLQPISNNIKETASIYQTMLEKLDVFNRGLLNSGANQHYPTATSILEGSAVIVQQRAISAQFGSDVSTQFIDTLLKGRAADTYLGALLLLRQIIGEPVPAQVSSLLLLSSLYGNFQDTSQRLRYPTDILIQLMSWFKEKRFDFVKLRSVDDLVHQVDTYYRKNQGGSLATMIELSQQANKGVLDRLAQTLELLEKQRGHEFPEARIVLKCYENFCHAHAMFSRQVLSDPGQYCSGFYIEHQYELLTPVIFIHTEGGVPVDDPLERTFYLQSEDRLYLTEDARAQLLNDLHINEAQREWLQNLPSNQTGRYLARNAYVLSPRNVPKRNSHNLIDVELWQQAYDVVGGLRLFMEGPNRGMPRQTIRQLVSVLNACGTRVYTSAGELEAPDIDPQDTPDMGQTLELLRQIKRAKK